MPNLSRKTTLRQFLFGDIDHDSVKNIDDYRPLDKSKSWPSPNSKYYHKAHMGGQDVKLSKVLYDTETKNKQGASTFNRLLKENKGSYGRVKTVPSTLDKLVQYHHNDIHDTSAVTIVTKDRKSAYKKASELKKKYKHDPKESDDFYKKPKNGVYYGLHLGLFGKNKERVEVQIKSKKMDEHGKKMHSAYKKRKDLTKFKKKGKELYKEGY